MANTVDVTVRASTAVVASGNGSSVDTLDPDDNLERQYARLTLEVAAVSGTLTVSIQSSTAGTGWVTSGSFATKTAVSFERIVLGPLERYVRCAWVLSAGGSATFSVAGQLEVSYADHEDFYRYGLPQSAATDIRLPTDAVARHLLAATDDAASSIPLKYTLPLANPYPFILRQKVCQLAARSLIIVRGYDPADRSDVQIVEAGNDAEKWFERVALGKLIPPWVDATPTIHEGGPVMTSDTARGW